MGKPETTKALVPEVLEKVEGKATEHWCRGLLVKAENLPLPQTREEYLEVVAALRVVKKEIHRLDNERKRLKAPINVQAKQIEDLFRGPLGDLKKAEDVLKGRHIERWRSLRGHMLSVAIRERRLALKKEIDRCEERIAHFNNKGDSAKVAEWTRTATNLTDEAAIEIERMKKEAEDDVIAPGISLRYKWKIVGYDIMEVAKMVVEGKLPPEAITLNEGYFTSLLENGVDIPEWVSPHRKQSVVVRDA